jgi:hypothetical protein
VALEVSSSSEPLREACADVFELARVREHRPMPSGPRARLRSGWSRRAEGAFVLARACGARPLGVAGN